MEPMVSCNVRPCVQCGVVNYSTSLQNPETLHYNRASRYLAWLT